MPKSSFYDYELTIGRRSGRVIKRNSNSFAKMQSILLRYNQDDIQNIEDTENNIIWWCIRKTDNNAVLAVGGPVPGISAQTKDVHCNFWSNVVKDQLDRDVKQ